MNQEDFATALRDLGKNYWDGHPFHHRLHNGSLSKEELRRWAANRWYYQSILSRKDAAIIANCPDLDVRRQWRARIEFHDDGGSQRWLRLCAGLGLSEDEVLDERHLLPGVRFAVDSYLNFARTRPWIEAVASGLTELFSPGLMRRRVADMRTHYPWLPDGTLDYFTNRISVAEGGDALEIVLRHCVTPEQQRAALAALSFKCDVLWAMLDAIDHGRR
ncbi:pyrroloquinoline quinone biosynthesis protein PqqC [Pseudonocardiaceae bacterium YIM PH 21723]|nr:pyrroloquinoline quinone biosynthesis protein PqqC [Pseudonocardiaceae bacterium YIM PH 21723]